MQGSHAKLLASHFFALAIDFETMESNIETSRAVPGSKATLFVGEKQSRFWGSHCVDSVVTPASEAGCREKGLA